MKVMGSVRKPFVIRLMLELAIIPIGLVSLFALFVGLTFGFNLWRLDMPLVTVGWLAVVLAPVWFYALLKWSENSSGRTVAVALLVALPAICLACQVF
ncbi:hypothetical protein WSK_2910 [Novosphingobium sp. Rr 2-17]|uniref:hypothetical protein n=1 Tax=Novosphingobium sp. Rr 2-17 TaxID=555793 RepID=UPI0002699F02|nr:hypothetical protein [Novosphingobium sp. Rr 2-17]EIZ78466.1 hypothetical protein WSK_2910 [Novosphingobium sp. Rr 2-17]